MASVNTSNVWGPHTNHLRLKVLTIAPHALASATRLLRSLLLVFSWSVRKASLDSPTDRRLAHLNSASYKHKLASLPVSRPRTTLKVLLKHSHGALI